MTVGAAADAFESRYGVNVGVETLKTRVVPSLPTLSTWGPSITSHTCCHANRETRFWLRTSGPGQSAISPGAPSGKSTISPLLACASNETVGKTRFEGNI